MINQAKRRISCDSPSLSDDGLIFVSAVTVSEEENRITPGNDKDHPVGRSYSILREGCATIGPWWCP